MFFRHHKQIAPTYQERLDNLRVPGISMTSEGPGKMRVSQNRYAAIIEDRGEGVVHVNQAGLSIGNEISELVNGGFQMFWRTPSGKTSPALAPQLTALHAFEEDLKESLGLTSLYNQSLGTTTDRHLYDRIHDRDKGVAARPWDK